MGCGVSSWEDDRGCVTLRLGLAWSIPMLELKRSQRRRIINLDDCVFVKFSLFAGSYTTRKVQMANHARSESNHRHR